MDPRDGHRECPHCLGVAHLVEDIEKPCLAAAELPLEERKRRAKMVEETARRKAALPPPEVGGSRHGPKQSRSRKRVHSPEHHRGRGPEKSAWPGSEQQGQPEDAQLKILAAIQGLSERLDRIEAQRPRVAPATDPQGLTAASQGELPSYQEERMDSVDVLSLYAHSSFAGSAGRSEATPEDEKLDSSLGGMESERGSGQDTETPALDVVSKILSAAKIVGLSVPAEAPSSVEGVWAGISQPQPAVSVPAAADYLQMLRKAWNSPAAAPQFNAGCRRLTRPHFAPDSGLADMPPVEGEMAALTSLGPERVTANPRCPVKECHKTDSLVCRTYNAATRAARSGNALAILLAAIRKTVSQEDRDTMSLIDAALVTHAQLTRDMGAAMSSAMLARRQVWLAQTTLPETIRKELTNLPVVPGRVFHPDSQGLLDKAEKSRRTRDSVQRTFHRHSASNYRARGGPQPPPQVSWSRSSDRRQGPDMGASGEAARQSSQRQRYASRLGPRGTPQKRRTPRGPGPQGSA